MARTARGGKSSGLSAGGSATVSPVPSSARHPLTATQPLLVVSADPRFLDEVESAFGEAPANLVSTPDYASAQGLLDRQEWRGVLLDLGSLANDPDAESFLASLCGGPARRLPIWTVLDRAGSFPLRQAALLDLVTTAVITRPLSSAGSRGMLLQTGLSPQERDRRLGALDSRELRGRTVRLETRVPDLFPVLEELELAAAHDVTVLVVGETGSGKTTLAQLVHELSSRAGERFMHLACGALPPTLIESELFGHVKGAFTGADRTKIGKFEAAGSGTLLLDEIDSLTPDQQAKLLRVIETGEFEPVGSNETLKLQARLIVASNVCLETLVSNQRFRMDLYYRLNVLKFQLPPLRERCLDVVPLALEFIAEVCRRCNVQIEGVHPEFLNAVKRYHWPGNIRELKNCMERAVILSRDVNLSPASLPPAVTQAVPFTGGGGASGGGPDGFASASRGGANNRGVSLNEKVANSEQTIIEEALRRHHNKRAPAARELGISRVTLYNKMRKYGLI